MSPTLSKLGLLIPYRFLEDVEVGQKAYVCLDAPFIKVHFGQGEQLVYEREGVLVYAYEFVRSTGLSGRLVYEKKKGNCLVFSVPQP